MSGPTSAWLSLSLWPLPLPRFQVHLKIFLKEIAFICLECAWGWVGWFCRGAHVEIRGQLEGIGSLGANSGDQAWRQASLLTMLSDWPTKPHFCSTCPFGSGNYTYTPGMAALSLL